ncbi:hypothetical protein PR048_005733 [Dryococelus australis]|uniref:Uncharacterized protein n=1 Tax=Dryococelus australis TaxID=614101 RepID=A0ABQ9I920_9NEOP|nr:hypothetical protein PR048_005733 [Dryococelus australis]
MTKVCLNSRPFTALSSDPGDLSALTPGHCLIADSLLVIPEAGEHLGKLHHVARWQLVHGWSNIFESIGHQSTCRDFRIDQNGGSRKTIFTLVIW